MRFCTLIITHFKEIDLMTFNCYPFCRILYLFSVQKELRDKNPFSKSFRDYSDLRIYNHLISILTKYSKNEEPFTIIINDSLSNSYIQKYSDNDKL